MDFGVCFSICFLSQNCKIFKEDIRQVLSRIETDNFLFSCNYQTEIVKNKFVKYKALPSGCCEIKFSSDGSRQGGILTSLVDIHISVQGADAQRERRLQVVTLLINKLHKMILNLQPHSLSSHVNCRIDKLYLSLPAFQQLFNEYIRYVLQRKIL